MCLKTSLKFLCRKYSVTLFYQLGRTGLAGVHVLMWKLNAKIQTQFNIEIELVQAISIRVLKNLRKVIIVQFSTFAQLKIHASILFVKWTVFVIRVHAILDTKPTLRTEISVTVRFCIICFLFLFMVLLFLFNISYFCLFSLIFVLFFLFLFNFSYFCLISLILV